MTVQHLGPVSMVCVHVRACVHLLLLCLSDSPPLRVSGCGGNRIGAAARAGVPDPDRPYFGFGWECQIGWQIGLASDRIVRWIEESH